MDPILARLTMCCSFETAVADPPCEWVGSYSFSDSFQNRRVGKLVWCCCDWLLEWTKAEHTIQAPPMGPLLANWPWVRIQVEGGSIQSEPNTFRSGSMVGCRPVSSIETAPSPVFCTSKPAYPSPDPTSEFRVLVDMGSGCSHHPKYIINCTMVLVEMRTGRIYGPWPCPD